MNKFQSIFLTCFYCIFDITTAFLTTQPAEIQDSYFRGRSGNMLLRPIGYQEPDISVSVLDLTGKVLQNSAPKEISIYNIADFIGRSLGLSPIHQEFHSSDYIQSDFFHRPMANLLIELDSIGDHVLSDSSINVNLNYLSSLRHGEIEAFPIKVTGMSYPSSSISLATSLISGQKPSRHGIIANKWKIADDSIAHGYSSNDPSTWSHAANLADIISQTFDGQSLTVSLSGSEQHAKANSVNPTLAGSHPTWTNGYTAHFRPENMDFIVTSQGDNPAIRRTFEDLTAKNLRNVFADQHSVLKTLEDIGVEATYRQGFVSLAFPVKDGTVQYVRYDLTLPEDMMLFAELQAAFSLVKVLSSSDSTSLIQDNYPDFYSVAFNSVTSLTEKYGRRSAQVFGALYLLDKSIPLVLDRFSALYPNRLLSEIVLLGSHPSSLSANNPDQRPLISIFERLLPSQNFFEKGLFPSLYIQASDEKQAGDDYCEILNLQLKEEQTGFELFCLPSRPNFNLNTLEQQTPIFITQASSRASAVTTDVYYADVAKYQIVLWISLLMLFTTIYVVYSLAFMSFKKDTIIYSTFNPKWENREAKRG